MARRATGTDAPGVEEARGRLRAGLPLGCGKQACYAAVCPVTSPSRRCSVPRGQAGLLTGCAQLVVDGGDAGAVATAWPTQSGGGGGGGGGVPVSGAAGGCLPARGCFRRRQTPHHAAQYAGSRRRCVGRSRASQRHGACTAGSVAPSCGHGRRLALLCAWAFASLVYTSPRYTNCSNCSFTSVGGSRTGPPAAAMTARRAAQRAAFCFFVRPRRRVAGLKRAAGRAADGCWLGGGGGRGGGGGAALRALHPGRVLASFLLC